MREAGVSRFVVEGLTVEFEERDPAPFDGDETQPETPQTKAAVALLNRRTR